MVKGCQSTQDCDVLVKGRHVVPDLFSCTKWQMEATQDVLTVKKNRKKKRSSGLERLNLSGS